MAAGAGDSAWGRARTRKAALAAGLLLALGQTAGGAQPARAQDTVVIGQVNRILVEGAQRVDDSTVKAYMTVAEGEPATASDISESVNRLMDTGLFQNVTISPLADGLLVSVQEAPYINLVAFEGNEAIDDETLRGAISSSSRAAFSRAAADRDAQTLLEIYRRSGRYGATVEPEIIERENNRVDLVFTIDEGEPTGVRSIDFVGNTRFSDSRLRGAIQTRTNGIIAFLFSSGTYDPDRLEYDKELLRRYYLDHGYADFRVLSATAELTSDREDFLITFTVDEGEVYTFGDLGIDIQIPGVSADEFVDIFPMKKGETYSISDVDKAIENLIYELGLKGYAFVDVRPRADKDPEAKTVGVTLEVGEGPRVYIERIDIEGNTRTVDRVLRRQFKVAEGDAYNAQEIEQARTRLRALNFFDKVEVRAERGSADDRAVIKTNVVEKLTGSLTFGVGYSSSDGPGGDVGVTERNFLGRGQTISTQLSIAGEEQAITFAFEEPALLDRDVAAGFQAGYTQLDRSSESSFEETVIGFNPYMAFPIADNQSLRLLYSIESKEIRDVRRSASPAIYADEGTALTNTIGGSWLLDERNDIVEPTDGYVVELKQDFAVTGGSTFFTRSTARAKTWTSLFDDDVVASIEAEAGALLAMGGDLRITDRFFLGGDSFRGFASGGVGPHDISTTTLVRWDPKTGKPVKPRQRYAVQRDDSLGGDYYAVLRSDISFPLGLPDEFGVYGGLFADVGTVWGLQQTVYQDKGNRPPVVIDDGLYLRAAVGVSVFIDSAFGPLRFNFAYPVESRDGDEREYFRFTVGTRF